MKPDISPRAALPLFATIVLVWGINWPVTKTIVAHIPPLWTAAIRTTIATVALFVLLVTLKKLNVPKRGDLPVVAAIGLFHMVLFSALMTAGLKYVPAGRSIVLGYTTPLWVTPGARLFLHERLPARRAVGIIIGLAGLALGFWAMAVVNRGLPATVTSLGILGTPVVGIVVSVLFLRESVDLSLGVATALILLGIGWGTSR